MCCWQFYKLWLACMRRHFTDRNNRGHTTRQICDILQDSKYGRYSIWGHLHPLYKVLVGTLEVLCCVVCRETLMGKVEVTAHAVLTRTILALYHIICTFGRTVNVSSKKGMWGCVNIEGEQFSQKPHSCSEAWAPGMNRLCVLLPTSIVSFKTNPRTLGCSTKNSFNFNLN
jgi:hypothetical protein